MSMVVSSESGALFAQETTSPSQVKIQIQPFYLKGQSCKIPQGAAVFQAEGKPENVLELNIATQITQANRGSRSRVIFLLQNNKRSIT